jgi:hypothetical protein
VNLGNFFLGLSVLALDPRSGKTFDKGLLGKEEEYREHHQGSPRHDKDKVGGGGVHGVLEPDYINKAVSEMVTRN